MSTANCFAWVKRLVYKSDRWIPHDSEIRIERNCAQRASWPEQGQLFKLFYFMLQINTSLKNCSNYTYIQNIENKRKLHKSM